MLKTGAQQELPQCLSRVATHAGLQLLWGRCQRCRTESHILVGNILISPSRQTHAVLKFS